MLKNQKWYDLRPAKALLDYVFENYPLTTTDQKVYRAFQSLESQQDGLSKDIVANHRTIMRCAKVSLNTVRAALKRLTDAGLIEYKPGSRDYAQRKASRIRRLSIAELKAKQVQEQPAHRLAAILNKRRIQYGKETVQPKYRVAVSNRLYAREPNVQSKKKLRPKRLAAGCKDGEVLIELDFVAADASVIAQTLGREKDGYQIIAENEWLGRDTVKKLFNPVVYARSTATAKAKHYGIKSPEGLAFIAEVDNLRDRMRKPDGKNVRSVTTATGTIITANPKKKVHKGTLLSYYAQGTIADFINRAALKIIELESSKGWRVAIPCHDSLYIIAQPEHERELAEIILAETEGCGLSMRLKAKNWRRSGHPQLCNPREYQKSGTSAHITPAA
jgi:DNA-binding transcriptional regulator YhcF (GntR family)